MKARTAMTAAALAAAAALTLSACGGGSDSDNKISPAPSTPATGAPTTAASVSAGEQITVDPNLALPADLKLSFEWTAPSDPTQTVALIATANFMQAMAHGVVKQNAQDPGLATYAAGDALAFGQNYVQQYISHGWTLTGTDRFYDPKVELSTSKTTARITLCENQSKVYGKEIKTEKVLTTQESDNSYVSYSIDVAKLATPTGNWQAQSITVTEKAMECKQ